jgi:hypothetical protein
VTNRPGSFARLWLSHFVSTLLVCVGAVVLLPAASHSDDPSRSLRSTGCGFTAAPATGPAAALTAGALLPEAPDSTDNDDDDGDEDVPGGSMVLPGPPVTAESHSVEFVTHVGTVFVHSATIDSHSLRAPPQ